MPTEPAKEDGLEVTYEWDVSIDGDERPCPVIFGPEGNYLLGASALESYNLLVDPTGERLIRAEWLSLGWGGEL